MSFLTKLFGTSGKKVIAEVVQSVENKGDTFIKEATNIVKNETRSADNGIKALREQLDKMGLGISKCVESRPGFRKYELSDGSMLTVNSESITQITPHSTTLNISREIKKPNFWEGYRCKKDTGEFVPEFLGARRDYMWNKEGLTKATSIQTTYLSQPEHIGRTRYTTVDIGDIPALPKVNTDTSIMKIPSDRYKYNIAWLDIPRPEYYGTYGRRMVTERQNIIDIHQSGKPLYTGIKYYNNYDWMKNPNIGRFGEF